MWVGCINVYEIIRNIGCCIVLYSKWWTGNVGTCVTSKRIQVNTFTAIDMTLMLLVTLYNVHEIWSNIEVNRREKKNGLMQAKHQDITASIYNIAQKMLYEFYKNLITYSATAFFVFLQTCIRYSIFVSQLLILVQFPFEITHFEIYNEKLKQFTCRRNICDGNKFPGFFFQTM